MENSKKSDVFYTKTISPMLIGIEAPPFDDENFIFELKLDGERCLAYLSNDDVIFINKRKKIMNPHVPELCQIHKQKKCTCILDGELIVLANHVPDFERIKNRSLTTNPYKIGRMADEFPASFTAFDILYYKDREVMELPLLERKDLLCKSINESERLAVSRHIFEHGERLFHFTKEKNLEGVVAKRTDSIYRPGTRTKDWIKCKNLLDEDFYICGYVLKGDSPTGSIILGRGNQNKLHYAGRVTMGLSRLEFKKIKEIKHSACMFDTSQSGAVYIEPVLQCTVKYMEKTKNGGLRQPIFKSLI